jgi:hypothetical protein
MSIDHWGGRRVAYSGVLAHVIEMLRRSDSLAEQQVPRGQRGERSRGSALDRRAREPGAVGSRIELLDASMAVTAAEIESPSPGPTHELGVRRHPRGRSHPGEQQDN